MLPKTDPAFLALDFVSRYKFFNELVFRIKGHSTKGMSCTDKNTMVFVVLEGEITVILHTTQVRHYSVFMYMHMQL